MIFWYKESQDFLPLYPIKGFSRLKIETNPAICTYIVTSRDCMRYCRVEGQRSTNREINGCTRNNTIA